MPRVFREPDDPRCRRSARGAEGEARAGKSVVFGVRSSWRRRRRQRQPERRIEKLRSGGNGTRRPARRSEEPLVDHGCPRRVCVCNGRARCRFRYLVVVANVFGSTFFHANAPPVRRSPSPRGPCARSFARGTASARVLRRTPVSLRLSAGGPRPRSRRRRARKTKIKKKINPRNNRKPVRVRVRGVTAVVPRHDGRVTVADVVPVDRRAAAGLKTKHCGER